MAEDNIYTSTEDPQYVKIQDIIGLPPLDNRAMGIGGSGPSMHHITKDAMPILEIMPCFQKFESGLQLYKLQKGLKTAAPHTKRSYIQELQEFYNITLVDKALSQDYIQFAYLNLNPPVESFTNDFEESIFAGITDTASKGFRQAAFLANTRDLGEGSKSFENALGKLGGNTGTKISDALGSARQALGQVAGSSTAGAAVGGAINTAARAATGRIDFPQFWRSSAWDASYSVSIRLYNPFPNDAIATEKFIIAPLAALMMFVTPRSTDGHTFHWPWLCKFRVRGLFDVQGGYVRSIQVIKGGDDNSIAFNQRVGIVDVKMELGTLYKTMVSGVDNNLTDRPFLKDWLTQFQNHKEWADESPAIDLDPVTNKLVPNGPKWVKGESHQSVIVQNPNSALAVFPNNLGNEEIVLSTSRKLFDSSATDRAPDTDFASRVQQASAPRGITLAEIESINNLSTVVNTRELTQDLIDATDAATQSGIDDPTG